MTFHSRFQRLALAILSIAIIATAAFAESARATKPNIILFLVDDMGLMDTSVPFVVDADGKPVRYPLNDFYRTPNMEKLAATGIRFASFYAHSVCSPTRASIMTGQNSARHRTTTWISSEVNNRTPYGPEQWNWAGPDEDTVVLPRLLQQAGYRTIHAGKAHFGPVGAYAEDPVNLGFDVNIAGNSYGQPGSYYGEDGYGHLQGNKRRAVPGLGTYHGTETYLSEALTLEANKEIEKSVKENRPFFLHMAHYAVHAPFHKDPRFLKNYEKADKSGHAKAFASMIEGIDKSLADIVAKTRSLGVADNTLVIFLGDNGSDAPLGATHGYASSAPLRGKKGTHYEGGMRVPFIVAWAETGRGNEWQSKLPITGGTVQTQPGTILDILPTICNLVGIELPDGMQIDGYDLSQQLIGKRNNTRKEDFLNHFPHKHRSGYYTSYVNGNWKVIYHYPVPATGRRGQAPIKSGCELYNLKDDPFEKADLADSHPEQLKSMVGALIKDLKAKNALYPEVGNKVLAPQMPDVPRKNAGMLTPSAKPAQEIAADTVKAHPYVKTVAASSYQAGNLPVYAVDADKRSRWAANGGSFPQSLEIELKAPWQAKGVTISFRNRTVIQYTVDVLGADGTWKTVVDQSRNSKEVQTVKHRLDAEIRKLKVTVLEAKQGWATITDLQIERAPMTKPSVNAAGNVPEKRMLWSGPAPIAGGKTEQAASSIRVYHPDKPNGTAVVICPGGGYRAVYPQQEGYPIGEWLNQHGITGILLDYRLPKGDATRPMSDVRRAIRTTRANAEKWRIDPNKIGVLGFSAGGHVASTAATRFDAGNPDAVDPIERVSSRPDFGIFIYPVISMGEHAHGGSKRRLIGDNPSGELVKHYSSELQVTAQTPPCFLAHAADDKAVVPENSRMFAAALKAKGVKHKYLELPSGSHGLNGFKGPMWEAWKTQSLQWLTEQGFVAAAESGKRTKTLVYPERTNICRAAEVDVYLLGGQSNMVGCGAVADIANKVPKVIPNAFFVQNQAIEPLTLGKTNTRHERSFGPEIGFALKMAGMARPVYVIKYAVSGMPLHPGWSKNKWRGTEIIKPGVNFYPGKHAGDSNQGSLYKNMLTEFESHIALLKAKGHTPVIRGFLWMQGEQDAKREESAKVYATSLKNLQARLSEDLGLGGNKLPMVFGQVVPNKPAPKRFGAIKKMHSQMAAADQDSGKPEAIPNCKMVPTAGFSMMTDKVHFDAQGQLALGRAMARAMNHLNTKGPSVPAQTPRKKSKVKVMKSVSDAPSGRNILWYEQPAISWQEEALPIGNGRLGGMVFGETEKERIQFNEETLWRANEDNRGSYQAFGDIYVEMPHENATNYRRQLDIANALQTITYTVGDTTYSREYFASYPANVMVLRFSADKAGACSGRISLTDAHNGQISVATNRITASGSVGGGADIPLQYEAQLHVQNQGGALNADNDAITFSNCDSVTLILAAGTDYLNRRDKGWHGEHPHERLTADLAAAAKKPFDVLRKEHVEDYQALFDRFSLRLGETSATTVQQPTGARLEAYKKGAPDAGLEELLCQYARYLMISSSRPGSLPANLQGIWNDSNTPAWGSDFHTDVNMQMNYWFVDMTSLPECFQPYAEWLYSIRGVRTEKTREHFSARGWTTQGNGNLFGGSKFKWINGTSAWLAQNLWDHYAYTLDKDYLRTRAYPIMRELCEFWEDLLKELPDGTLVSPDGYSPEHGPIGVDGVSFDQQVVWDLFTNTIEASEALGIDEAYRRKIASLKSSLMGPKIGKWGQLQEWMEDIDDPKNQHRHLSHMIAVHPGRQISPLTTPEFAEAAKVSMNARGDASTGWSKAWKINIWARLHDGNRAYKLLNEQIKNNYYSNLFGFHPPFQIDGNFGYASGLCEMVVQSHLQVSGVGCQVSERDVPSTSQSSTNQSSILLHLLPALPDAWPDGQVKGLRARGGIVIDMDWKDGQLVSATLLSENGTDCALRYGGKVHELKLKKGERLEFVAR